MHARKEAGRSAAVKYREDQLWQLRLVEQSVEHLARVLGWLVGWLVGVRVFYAGWDWLGLTGTSWDTNNVDVAG